MIGSIKWLELLTPGPIRVGTRIRAQRAMFGRDTTEELEIVEIERPRRLRLLARRRLRLPLVRRRPALRRRRVRPGRPGWDDLPN